VQIALYDKQMVQFVVNVSGEWRRISPEYVGSLILKQLRETVERNLSVPLHRAVMAVPAEFDEQQRNFTKSAAQLAGGTLFRLLTYQCICGVFFSANLRYINVLNNNNNNNNIGHSSL